MVIVFACSTIIYLYVFRGISTHIIKWIDKYMIF